ncbi:MAG: hypothetical protein Q8868_06380 [Bacteroidota bacterium]|nr:hypothetical protein [Bacteroidota bacterium]
MKKIVILSILLSACFFKVLLQDTSVARQITYDPQKKNFESAVSNPVPSGCTVFTISKGGNVFFGGNDDYINPDSYFWVDPGNEKKYGVIWIGQPDNVQQGVNEKGLAYDANGLPRVNVNPHSERTPVSGDYTSYPVQIMHECATVMEVINWIKVHQWHSYMHDQMQFADKTGDAVIISAGKDGELVFTRKQAGDGLLVSTNFNVANTDNSYSYPCWRYVKAQELLGKLLKKSDPITAIDARNVLEAVHVEKGASWTIESMLADLVNGTVYLYYYYQFDHPVVLNVKEELSNPREAGPLSKLFPDDVQKEAGQRYDRAYAGARLNKIVGISWTVLILCSLILLLIIPTDNKKGFWFWIIAVIFLGPFAFILKLLTVKSLKTSRWTGTLVETIGNLIPIVAIYTVALTLLILKSMTGAVSWQFQLAMVFGLPLLAGWLLFHGPMLASSSQISFIRFLMHRLPHVIVSTFLGLAGIFIVSMPLANRGLNMSQLIPLSPWAVMNWWAIVILGALPGGILIYLYERWAVKKGFSAWIILAGSEGKVITPSWRELWWWIVISIQILIAGLIAGVMLVRILS